MSSVSKPTPLDKTTSKGSVYADVDHDPVTTVLPNGDVPYTDHAMDADERVIVALGYKQEFKREFSLWTTFCVSFAVLGLLPSFASTIYYGMGYAGTAGMVWGWIIAMVFIQCVAMSMAELCSAMPTSGGLYYAAAVLAPPGYGPFAAWITGWSNWIGQITAAPSVDFSLAAMILAAASIQNPDYVPTSWQTFLLTTLIMILHAVISSMPTKWVAQFNSWGSTFNMFALIAVIIAIPAGTKNEPKFTPSKEVWGTITNLTDFPDGVAVLMTFVGVIWTMSGYDSPFHLSEECSNANIASPRAIVMTSGVGGLMGWFLQLVVAYTVLDIEAIIDSDLGQPWASYLLQVMPQKAALGILALTIICGFSMGQGCMVAASRVTYAYARDDCFPLSKVWKKVDSRTKTPVNAVIINAILGILMCLLILAGDVAIGALFSIGAIAQFVAFAIPICIRVFFVGNRFRRGPWHLGPFGPYIGAVGVLFVLLMVPILCLPSVTGDDLTPDLMNWTCLVWGAPMLAVTIWWVVDAHKWFKGPKVNVEHAIHPVEEGRPVVVDVGFDGGEEEYTSGRLDRSQG
ncbi:amino acid permease GABA permease [Aspergillus parasiticus SU-1]|uniref:Amino acid permease-domain-containing protein n=2 Tax=Aspergillus parasiticus TaxID=5067 RepID=A0A5N6DEK5_ASPPA|nr:amino acid permease-domain-containing protein [Aspergillus parasiticus]KJK61277.1 amino acid permease GABA permease [Aspergillus parasiticus SU-1]